MVPRRYFGGAYYRRLTIEVFVFAHKVPVDFGFSLELVRDEHHTLYCHAVEQEVESEFFAVSILVAENLPPSRNLCHFHENEDSIGLLGPLSFPG